jgi:hypothetical protein
MKRAIADKHERRYGADHFADAAADIGRREPGDDLAAIAVAAGEYREHRAKDGNAERRADHARRIDKT